MEAYIQGWYRDKLNGDSGRTSASTRWRRNRIAQNRSLLLGTLAIQAKAFTLGPRIVFGHRQSKERSKVREKYEAFCHAGIDVELPMNITRQVSLGDANFGCDPGLPDLGVTPYFWDPCIGRRVNDVPTTTA